MVNSSIWCFKCVDGVYSDCGCDNQPVITEINKCPVLAMIYIDTHLAADLSNACAVLNYVKQTYKCVPLPLEPDPQPPIIDDEDDEWVDEGGNDNDTDDDYNEYLRKSIWWYHTDHLGSSTYLTDNFGRPSHYYETLPFGEMIVEHNQSKYYKIPYPTTNTGSYDNKWKFNGKELDDATGMYYYGARYYDPRISIWISVDQKAEKTMTPYQYVNNNPVMFTDPTGMEAIIVFNAKTAQLMITDMDHYKKGLKTKYVNAQEYKIGGIRDSNGNLTHNQTLVINGVFSGGKGTSDGILQGGQNGVENVSYGPKMIPIPNGEYDVLNNDDGYYRLDAVDSYRYDDTTEFAQQRTGADRKNFRLHPGTLSFGCVTINTVDNENRDRDFEWQTIQNIMNSTSTTEVPDRQGRQRFNPSSTRTRFGSMKVNGTSINPKKNQERDKESLMYRIER